MTKEELNKKQTEEVQGGLKADKEALLADADIVLCASAKAVKESRLGDAKAEK